MKNLQITLKPLILLFAIGFAFASCGSDDNNNQTPGNGNGNETDTSTLKAEYTFTQIGGDFDGETISHTIAHELNAPPKFKKEGVSEQFNNDRIEFMFTDSIGNLQIKMNMFIMLDTNKNPQPLGIDLSTESTIALIYSDVVNPTDPNQVYTSKSQSGDFSFINLNIEEPFDWNPGIAPLTFNVDFNGVFKQMHMASPTISEDVQISGNIRVYRSN